MYIKKNYGTRVGFKDYKYEPLKGKTDMDNFKQLLKTPVPRKQLKVCIDQ